MDEIFNIFPIFTKTKNFLSNSSKKLNENTIDRVFLDPIGYHCILSNDSGKNWYLNINENKIRYLSKVHDTIISSAAFTENTETDTTNYFLITVQ